MKHILKYSISKQLIIFTQIFAISGILFIADVPSFLFVSFPFFSEELHLVILLELWIALQICPERKPPNSQFGSWALAHPIVQFSKSVYFFRIRSTTVQFMGEPRNSLRTLSGHLLKSSLTRTFFVPPGSLLFPFFIWPEHWGFIAPLCLKLSTAVFTCRVKL